MGLLLLHSGKRLMAPVVGPVMLPPCGVCGRPQVRARRQGRTAVLLCLTCDGGPLVDETLAQLDEQQRRTLGL